VPGTKIKNIDKLAHFLEFAVFGYLLVVAMTSSQMSLNGPRILLILLIGTLFAILDESFQSLVPGRQTDIFDGLADVLGVIVTLLLWHVVGWIKRLRRAGAGRF
jgi:VanZ family protein